MTLYLSIILISQSITKAMNQPNFENDSSTSTQLLSTRGVC